MFHQADDAAEQLGKGWSPPSVAIAHALGLCCDAGVIAGVVS